MKNDTEGNFGGNPPSSLVLLTFDGFLGQVGRKFVLSGKGNNVNNSSKQLNHNRLQAQ